jgi:glyoxylase-like metal-dependent hydrolase (beta-lactamase superfamily II)
MDLGRRQFLRAAMVLPVLGTRQAAVRHQGARVVVDRGFARVTRLADGVYATIANPARGQQCYSNGGVIVGRDAVLVIEAHLQPAGAEFEIGVARQLTTRPIIAAINTHFHLDHTFGNAAYARNHIPVMAHERVPALMKEKYTQQRGADKAGLLRPIEKEIADARRKVERDRLETELGLTKWVHEVIDASDIVYPTDLLTPADCPKRIDLGGLIAIVDIHVGHTPTDLIVRVPQRGIVFVGDLLVHRGYPVAIDADMLAWRRVLSRLARESGTTRLVPGHGPISGPDTIRDQIDLMDDLHRHAFRMIEAGGSVEEATRRYVVPARFREYENPCWGWTVGGALRSYYRGLQNRGPAQVR